MIEWPAEIDLEEDRIDDFQPPKKPWYWYPKQVILLIFVMISYFLIHNGRLIREEGYGLILSGIALLVISTMLLLEDPPVRIPETQTLTKAVRAVKNIYLILKKVTAYIQRFQNV